MSKILLEMSCKTADIVQKPEHEGCYFFIGHTYWCMKYQSLWKAKQSIRIFRAKVEGMFLVKAMEESKTRPQLGIIYLAHALEPRYGNDFYITSNEEEAIEKAKSQFSTISGGWYGPFSPNTDEDNLIIETWSNSQQEWTEI